MTIIYTSVEQRFNKIFFRGYKNGKRVQTNDAQFKPILYTPTDIDTGIKSLYGKNLTPTEFNTIGEAKTYVKSYKELLNVHGNDRYEYDFIHRNFRGEQAVTIDSLSVLFLDIETSVELGFPDVMNPEEEVLLISNYHMGSKKMTTFGCKPYSGDGTNYVHCLNEADLLTKWINYCIDIDFDIMTGWNVIPFDMAYLGSRIIKVLGQRALNRLSPFGIVEAKTETIMDREILRYEIAGRTVLDMLELYKKFRFINRPNYKLAYIGQVEVGDTKTENPYKTFKEHYTVGWNDSEGKEDGFVRYNIQDVNLLVRLEEKLGLVYLAVTLAYLTKINFSDVYSPVKTWESHILSTLLEENTFCELKTVHKSDYRIVGGYVKEPVPGMYKWNVTFDATSLYPSIIMSLNMSPETLVDMLPSVSVESLLDEHPTHSDADYAVAANGVRFRKDTHGVMPRLTQSMFNKRKTAKNEMLRLKKLYESTHEEQYKLESARYGVLQLAVKVVLNCLFGCSSSQYFLFFDNRIAEGITMTGQYIIQKVQHTASDYMGKVLKSPGEDFISYSDTDSLGVCMNKLVQKNPKKMNDNDTTDFIIKFVDAYMSKELDKCTDSIAKILNMYENKISFKTEGISSAMIILAKKRNCQKVIDNEGVRYSEPEYKVTGVETQRSSTPDLVRGWLMDAIKLVLDDCDRDALVQYIDKRRSEFRTYSVEDIAFPRSANNLTKYADGVNIYTGGTPIAVRAALLYNNLVKKNGLERDLELIKEGNKIKYVALKEPNTLKEDIIGFPSELPTQFNLHRYVDYDTQFEKAFLDPLVKIMDAMDWKLEEENSLNDFF